jgi:small-conductance mechanosensitive channel
LCNGDHPANYKGCEYYHSLIRPNNANNRLNIHQRIKNPNAPPRIEDKTTWQHQQYYHQNLQHNQQNTSYAGVVKKGSNNTANEDTNILTKLLEEFKSMFNQIIQQNSMVLNLLTTLIGKIH